MKPFALGAYIFAGSFTVGVQSHFDVLAHFEEGPYGASCARRNFPDLPVIVGPRRWPLGAVPRDLPFLYGNPPCAAWSAMNRGPQRGWTADPRVDCARTHFNLLERLQPRVWAWESVTEAYNHGRPLVRALGARARRLGYDVSHVLHDGCYLGGWQRRKRYFMVCHRVGIDWAAARPSFTPPRTATEALTAFKHAGSPGPAAAPRTPASKEVWEIARSEARGDLFRARGMLLERRPKFNAVKLSVGCKVVQLDKPVGVVAGPRLLHPTEHRCLTIGEMLFLSGLPPDFVEGEGSTLAQANLIGRGVMPPVGAWLAGIVAGALRRDAAPVGVEQVVNFLAAPGAIAPLE